MLDAAALAAYIASQAGLTPGDDAGPKQQDITVNTAVDDTDYTWTVTFGSAPDDVTITYTINSGPGATVASIGAQIRAAIDNDTDNDGPGGIDEFIEEGAGVGAVAEVVGKIVGDLFVVASSDPNLTIGAATYASTVGDEIEDSVLPFVGDTLSPATLTGDEDDYNPTGLDQATVLRIDGGASNRTITGIVSNHRTLIVINAGATNTLIFTHEDVASSAANRFNFVGGASRVLVVFEAVVFVYDSVDSRWKTAS